MGNIIDYVYEYGNYTFSEMPLNEVDSLVLCQLIYLDYENYVPGLEKRIRRSVFSRFMRMKTGGRYWRDTGLKRTMLRFL